DRTSSQLEMLEKATRSNAEIQLTLFPTGQYMDILGSSINKRMGEFINAIIPINSPPSIRVLTQYNESRKTFIQDMSPYMSFDAKVFCVNQIARGSFRLQPYEILMLYIYLSNSELSTRINTS